MDRVVFSFGLGLLMGFTFNRHTVFRKPQDNREITATFCTKFASLVELNARTEGNNSNNKQQQSIARSANIATNILQCSL